MKVVIITTQKSQLPYKKRARLSGGGANARTLQLEKADSRNDPRPAWTLWKDPVSTRAEQEPF